MAHHRRLEPRKHRRGRNSTKRRPEWTKTSSRCQKSRLLDFPCHQPHFGVYFVSAHVLDIHDEMQSDDKLFDEDSVKFVHD